MLSLRPGEIVYYQGEEYRIGKIQNDLKHVIIRHSKTNQPEHVLITELSSPEAASVDEELPSVRPLDSFTEQELEKARVRFEIIKPLIEEHSGDRNKLLEVAKEKKIGRSTLYKWISAYQSTGHVGSLVDREGRGGKGKMRLDEEVERMIENVINDKLMKQGKSFNVAYQEIRDQCEKNGYEIPHANTIRNRFYNRSEFDKNKYRRGPRAAAQIHEPKVGHLPDAELPLQLAQIDHTLLDVMLVDEVHRKPLGRPWFTLVLDSGSRVPLGFYLSFDPPGAYGTGRAIVHALMPKEKYLASLGVSVEWPCWGKMKKIKCDNAREFKGNMLKQSCLDYGMILDFRPVKKPNYGGHIERWLGTFNKEIHDLPGATNANKELRMQFDPVKLAAMTLHELEKWMVIFITEVYLKRVHSGIDMSPLDNWKEGLLGTPQKPGIGVPERFTDESRLLLDFMPYTERTVQRGGVQINKISYYGQVLNKWINTHEKDGKTKRKFKFKQDPRDISKLYFLDPDVNQYFEIPYLDIGHPKMSKWEYNTIIAKLKDNLKPVNEHNIFEGYKMMRKLEEQSKHETKTARKRNERESKMKRDSEVKVEKSKPQSLHAFSGGEIKPFED